MASPYEAGWMEYWRLSLPELEAYNRRFPRELNSEYWTTTATLLKQGLVPLGMREDDWVCIWAVILNGALERGIGVRMDAVQVSVLWREAATNAEWRAAMMSVWALDGGEVIGFRSGRPGSKALKVWLRKNLPKRYTKVAEDEET